jgi:hypothetical protein
VPVEVLTAITISRPADVVAAYAGDPSNAPGWYANISSIRWQTEPPLRTWSRANRKNLRKLRSILEAA